MNHFRRWIRSFHISDFCTCCTQIFSDVCFFLSPQECANKTHKNCNVVFFLHGNEMEWVKLCIPVMQKTECVWVFMVWMWRAIKYFHNFCYFHHFFLLLLILMQFTILHSDSERRRRKRRRKITQWSYLICNHVNCQFSKDTLCAHICNHFSFVSFFLRLIDIIACINLARLPLLFTLDLSDWRMWRPCSGELLIRMTEWLSGNVVVRRLRDLYGESNLIYRNANDFPCICMRLSSVSAFLIVACVCVCAFMHLCMHECFSHENWIRLYARARLNGHKINVIVHNESECTLWNDCVFSSSFAVSRLMERLLLQWTWLNHVSIAAKNESNWFPCLILIMH